MKRAIATAAVLLLVTAAVATEFRVQFGPIVGGSSYYVAVNETPAVAITPSPAAWAATPNPSALAIYVRVPGTPGQSFNFRVCGNGPNQPSACSENVTAGIPTLTATASATPTSSATATRTAPAITPPSITPLHTPDIYDVTGNGRVSAFDAARFLQRGEPTQALCALRLAIGFACDS